MAVSDPSRPAGDGASGQDRLRVRPRRRALAPSQTLGCVIACNNFQDARGFLSGQQVGPDGQSAVEITADVVRTWTVLREALRQIQVSDTPVVHAAVVDPSERHWESPVRETVAEAARLAATVRA